VIDEVPNPAIQFITAIEDIEGVESLVPELNVQEVDSVIQVNSGQPIVMGGLLQDRVDVGEEAVPVLGEVPLLGAAFRTQNDRVSKTELVIFLKATILQSPSDSVHNTDKDIYRQFSGDRRPLRF
jgi:general secretion pathway protein D